ncbi:flagellar protein FlbB [Treponema parvum]|uniref:Flagellar protein FlbB n=1 Tax=Treponema parvum TaxID=138851 RepID=A0A975F3B6_9SPIR|nr:flagellar protein FlbB [Treponema parvum]QTQ13623.1 flagellar protein FlbB [Treponema parvum]
MARHGSGLGKSIVLLFLIVILILGGLLWFDYLGVIHAKTFFSPVYRLLGREPQTSLSSTSSHPLTADLDQDRLDRQREALNIYKQELDKRDEDLAAAEQHNRQIAQELEERIKTQEEREKTFNNVVKKYDDKNVNIVQISQNLTGMAPQNAVNILLAMDDQTVIDVLRKVEEQAKASGSSSMVSYWLSLMPATRAAEIQRKMVNKPESLN